MSSEVLSTRAPMGVLGCYDIMLGGRSHTPDPGMSREVGNVEASLLGSTCPSSILAAGVLAAKSTAGSRAQAIPKRF